jgi:hypothetical protein
MVAYAGWRHLADKRLRCQDQALLVPVPRMLRQAAHPLAFLAMRRTVLVVSVISVIVLILAYVLTGSGSEEQPHRPDVSGSDTPVVTTPEASRVPSTSSVAPEQAARIASPRQDAPAVILSNDELEERVAAAIGRTQPINPDRPGAASVIEALNTGTHPERLSVAHAPAPFDPVAFAKNPQAYLDIVEPGRVFQPAKPASDVPSLMAIADHRQRIRQGEQAELAVKGAPLGPVTFTSLDLGTFAENGLASVTVRADEHGEARVRLVAGPGTDGEIRTLVASPMASGTIRFIVEVVVPLDPALTRGVLNN